MPAVLDVKNIQMNFKGLKAVGNFSLKLEEGIIQGLIGTNGAGKTTVFNILTGMQRPTSGSVMLGDTDITGMRPDRIAKLGMSRTFQNLRLFGKMTVLDNVIIGAQLHKNYNFFEALTGLGRFRPEEAKLRDMSMELLEIMGLSGYSSSKTGSLPYGHQRRLEIARALATKPRLLLLDEPAAGMNPMESQELMETIREVRKRFNLTILLIEHDMQVVMQLCDYIQVLCYGETIAEGIPSDIRSNPQVIEAYLGRSATSA